MLITPVRWIPLLALMVCACPAQNVQKPLSEGTPITVDDPYFPEQGYLHTLGVPALWAQGIRGSGVRIGVIDNGFFEDDPDLAGRYEPEMLVMEGSVVHREDMLCASHGSTIASTMAAGINNGIGLAGIAPDVTLVRVAIGCPGWVELDSPTPEQRMELHTAYLEDILTQGAEAVRWMVDDRHVHIINISQALGSPLLAEKFGLESPYYIFKSALQYADAKGVVVVMAAGNWVGIWDETTSAFMSSFSRTEVQDLAAQPFTLAAGCVCAQGSELCEWEHIGEEFGQPEIGRVVSAHRYGDDLDLVVPCDHVPSVVIEDDELRYVPLEEGGTSNAAPQISALLALVMSAHPHLTAHQARALLLKSATDLFETGRDAQSGHGLVDVAAAIKMGAQDHPP